MMRKKSEVATSSRKSVEKVREAKKSLCKNSKASDLEEFPIVAIGASAGGLEALELFLRNVPRRSGMACVIVQHLDPTRKGIMVELLQRITEMPVIQVSDRQKVQPNHVYVIPPNCDMSILHGTLHLLEPSGARGLRLPIDFFFRAVAEDLQDRSIGVILSGMGSDGTLGIQAIKEKAGLVLVQKPETAKFDGMPRSAINGGLVDIIAPVEELPEKILTFLKHLPNSGHAIRLDNDNAQSGLEKIALILREQTGHDFSLYKMSTVCRRVERRMGVHLINRIEDYVRYLRENPQEGKLLFKELLIGVTSFFRDPPAWEKMRAEVIPSLFSNRSKDQKSRIRAWIPGCATGEEAYSLAILFKEAMDELRFSKGFSLQIFATDLDPDAIDKARLGIFPANIVADVTPERLKRFFVKKDGGFQIAKAIREMVVFAQQNCIMDPPFTKLDLVSCRNLLIYLTPALQKKMLPLFHYSLRTGGCLFLGSAETIGSFSDLFNTIDAKARLYRRRELDMGDNQIDFPVGFATHRRVIGPEEKIINPSLNLEALAEKVLLNRFSPAAVMTNEKGDIAYFSGKTGKFLEPAAGKVNWSVFAMAREELRYELINGFQSSVRTRRQVNIKNLTVANNGGKQTVEVTIVPLTEPDALKNMFMVIFSEVAPSQSDAPTIQSPRGSAGRLRHQKMAAEIDHLRQELQSTREEMQSSQEELRSANEELQSTNEELQSTNEELTTSREEMQSMNEELQTLNHELQAKVEELSLASNDMKNLLDSTDIATLFLDSALNVRRFTSQAVELFKLIPSDVGRPITDVAMALEYPEFTDDVSEVLRTLVFQEKQIPTRDGRWFVTRIMPYRTLDNFIDGVVITFSDISAAKKLEEELRKKDHAK